MSDQSRRGGCGEPENSYASFLYASIPVSWNPFLLTLSFQRRQSVVLDPEVLS